MSTLEYVHIMQTNEVKSYISKFREKAKQTNSITPKYRDSLIDKYHKVEKSCFDKYKIDLDNFKKESQLWKIKKCNCGSNLNFVRNYKFWGCPKYQINNNIKHITFSENHAQILSNKYENIKVRISRDWCTDILKSLNLNKKIKAKELLLFFISNNLNDLRYKYGYNPTIETISSFVKANRRSKIEELEIKDFLEDHFNKSSFQTYIKYKLQNEYERIKILDLIVSDKKSVYLIEIKRNDSFLDLNQLNFYSDLMKKIMLDNNDKRQLKKLFIVYEENEYSYAKLKFVNFKFLKTLSSKKEIEKEFIKNLIV